MTKTPIAHVRAEEISGIYWTPPAQATIAEIHPLLMAIVVSKPNYKDWLAYSANDFEMSSGGPVGYFEIVLDPAPRGHVATIVPSAASPMSRRQFGLPDQGTSAR